MKNTAQLAREERQQARRELIRDAADELFKEKGLAATSMADIAKRTQLGAGQIYRLFENKEAIVKEIIAQRVEGYVEDLLSDYHSPKTTFEDLACLYTNERTQTMCPDSDRNFILEVYAEATRNELVNDILLEKESLMKDSATQMLRKTLPDATEVELEAMVEFFGVMHAGTIMRRPIREFYASPEKECALKKLYNKIYSSLFERCSKTA
ncbi:TetR/AcrR family transcriptional regulator [Halioxenophilus aromaticivorans]|uniref:TetR/AcrR family transcriptional regulator n=1 Tax=Halioxenophilus aromaticivorans TaxID=1306992 RepID=A0AAV3U6M6_9ALTE